MIIDNGQLIMGGRERAVRLSISMFLLLIVMAAVPSACFGRGPNGSLPLLGVERQVWRPGESIRLTITDTFSRPITLSIRQLYLTSLIKKSNQITSFNEILRGLPAGDTPMIRSWVYNQPGDSTGQETERTVPIGSLPPGVYWVRARFKNHSDDDWFAVTPYGVIAKQSRQELLLFAVDLASGKPLAGVRLTTLDDQGRRSSGATDGEGILRLSLSRPDQILWAYGEKDGSPIFNLSIPPTSPFPFRTFLTTDRPLYRPSQNVFFKGTIRSRSEAIVPGGFVYKPYAGKTIPVSIHDGKGALVYQQNLPTNEYGSFNGELQLAGDPSLGTWRITVELSPYKVGGSASFQVEAYRKPEMTVSVRTDRPQYVGGSPVPVTVDAQFYFGRPVADASVHYTVSFGAEGGRAAEQDYEGTGITDKNGQLKIPVRTRRLPVNRQLTVQATVSDLSRRSATASGSAQITAGQFQLSLETDKSVYLPDEPVVVSVEARDYNEHPVAAPVRLQLIETMLDRLHRPYRQVTTRKLRTNAAGKASATFTPQRHGELVVEALGFDPDDNKILTVGTIYVSGGDEGGMEGQLAFHLQGGRAEYWPGEKASLLLETGLVNSHRHREVYNLWQPEKPQVRWAVHPDAWALVTLEGERLYNYRVVHLTSRSSVITMPLSALQFPSASLQISVVQEGSLYAETKNLPVAWEPHRLNVALTPDKRNYRPGETATYTISTQDSSGHPVPAELSVGVVDRSVLQEGDNTGPDMDQFFYGPQSVRVESRFSFAERYYYGRMGMVGEEGAPENPSGMGQGGSLSDPELAQDPRIRRRFRDTAYWAPLVQTDNTGKATVSFPWPDNLTTWRALAQGSTLSTMVGQDRVNVVSTKPLLVRLELPRFYVQGDEATLSTIVHNYTGIPRTVNANLEVTGARLLEDAHRTLQLAPGSMIRLDWKARVDPGISAESGEEPQGATFVITADGGVGAQDAMQLTLPVQVAGLKMVQAQASSLSRGSDPFRLDLAALPPGASVTLSLSPSLAASMFSALDELNRYPYNCAEQTMSKLVPNVLSGTGFQPPVIFRHLRKDLPAYVNSGLQDIYHYQHSDGGWNWWDFDQTDGDMTAYILQGLIRIRDAGFMVDPNVIKRGTAALEQLLQNQADLNRRADWLLTLTSADPNAQLVPVFSLWEQRSLLDSSHQAALALALQRLSDASKMGPEGFRPWIHSTKPAGGSDMKLSPNALHPADLRRMAAAVTADIDTRAIIEGTTAHWANTNGERIWQNDDRIVTARVLQALVATGSHIPNINGAVRWLMGNRQGDGWGPTITTAHVFMALTDYLRSTAELEPNFHSTLALDGQPLREITMTPANAFDPPTLITLKPGDLKGHTTLTIDQKGQGILYLDALIGYTLPPDKATPMSKGITVRRTFTFNTEDPLTASSIPTGQDVDVQVDLTADTDYRYAILEDPIPAGCQLEPTRDNNYMFNYILGGGEMRVGREEMRDDQVVFFLDNLSKGHTSFSYRMHAESPGVYRVQPGSASLVYFPEIRGSSALVTARIAEETGIRH